MASDPAAQIRAALTSQSLPPPSQTWLSNLLASRPKPLPPLPSLIATARARLLAADLSASGLIDPSYAATNVFPAVGAGPQNIGPEVVEAQLSRDMVVQVLDVENLSRSRWDQADELEAVVRGELTRGREIIRLPAATSDGEDEGAGEVTESQSTSQLQQKSQQKPGSGPGTAAAAAAEKDKDKNATHRLVLQDCKGQKLFGLELHRVEKIGVGKTFIGEKIMLRRGTVVARGSVLLEPRNCVVLGGKVEAWHKAWLEGRLARLKEAAGISDSRRL